MKIQGPLDALWTAKIWFKTFILENNYSKRKRKMMHMPTNLLIAYIRLTIVVAIVDSYLDKIFADARHLDVPSPSGRVVRSARASKPDRPIRAKRNILQFGNMLSCFDQHLEPMDYVDYGCYCGPGGQGQPVDDTDWCCVMHDKCWEDVQKDPECTGFSGPYMITYNWGCSSTTKIHCYDEPNTCDRKTCECDRIAIECFAKTRPTYDEKNYELGHEHCNTTFVDNRNDGSQHPPDAAVDVDDLNSSAPCLQPNLIEYILFITFVTIRSASV